MNEIWKCLLRRSNWGKYRKVFSQRQNGIVRLGFEPRVLNKTTQVLSVLENFLKTQ